jgi:ABC-type nitrate/sulfonate/bicarbonate transport system permease component
VSTPTLTREAARSGGRRTPARRRILAQRKGRGALRLLSLIVLLALWEWYGRHTSPILFTYPMAVVQAGVDMVKDGTLLTALRQSMTVLAWGFALGTVAGVAVGLAMGRSPVFAGLLELPVTALYATPMVALVPVFALWFGFGTVMKIVVVLFFTFFPVLINTVAGVQEVDPKLVEVARAFCSSERRLWIDLVLPSALPYILAGIRLAIGRGLTGVIVAEFYAALSGLGYLIESNANSFHTARVFVPIVVLMILGVASTAVLGMIEARFAPWRSQAR